MPAHTQPIIKPLQSEVHILVRFQFQHCEAAIITDSQQVKHAAVAGLECGHLRVDVIGIEARCRHFLRNSQTDRIRYPLAERSSCRFHARGLVGLWMTWRAAAERALFRRLRKLLEDLNAGGHSLDTLSMGMSGDFESAIAEGATLVRIGTALFGARGTQ